MLLYTAKRIHMPTSPHVETHFRSSESVRDVVIGMADGLTVPFALAAGLSAIAVSAGDCGGGPCRDRGRGSIAMGLGGYLAARSDAEHYASERRREELEIVERLHDERHEVLEILDSYGLTLRTKRLDPHSVWRRGRRSGWIG